MIKRIYKLFREQEDGLLEESLSAAESGELAALERENMKAIEEGLPAPQGGWQGSGRSSRG